MYNNETYWLIKKLRVVHEKVIFEIKLRLISKLRSANHFLPNKIMPRLNRNLYKTLDVRDYFDLL